MADRSGEGDRVSRQDASDVELLCEFVASSRGPLGPGLPVESVRLLVLDSLGCAVLAAHLVPAVRLVETVRATESPGRSRVWLHADRFSAPNAAMINATAVHGFELDDITTSLGHYGCVTVPVALALADAGALVSGVDLIRAIVAGIEVGLRVNECVGSVPHTTCGFHGPSVFGAFAAAATASSVLGLSADQCVDALAHAAQFAGGLMGAQHGGMGKRLLPGRSAHAGVFAAQLAAHGFTNTPRIFDCGYGSFPEAFSGGRDCYDLHRLSADLGAVYRSAAISFKMWACRIPIHPTLEAIRQLQAEVSFSARDVERVEVRLPGGSFRSVGHRYEPDTVASAQLNLQFCVAVMLEDGDVFQQQFTERTIRDPAVIETASKVQVLHDPALDADTVAAIAEDSVVEVTLTDGRRLARRGRLRGTGGDPITRDEIAAKFVRMTGDRLPVAARDELIVRCFDLERLDDVSALTDLLGPGA